MNEPGNSRTLKVSFRGKELEVPGVAGGGGVTRGSLRYTVAEATGVSPELLRVFCRGTQIIGPWTEKSCTVNGNEESTTIVLESGAKVMVLASKTEEVLVTQKATADPLVRPFEGTKRTSKYIGRPRRQGGLSSGFCGFGRIEALSGFDDSDKAHDLLVQLSEDEGVSKVMVKHNYNVGTLKEMYPEGKVGIDPVCVMGLNKGRGMEILLRLRTDDLAGFRPYWKIREVLFHELAHNTHSDHSKEFYALMRLLQTEADEIDWRTRRGRTTGDPDSFDSHSFYQHVEQETPFRFWEESERLGGRSKTSARQAAATAALARLSATEATSGAQNLTNCSIGKENGRQANIERSLEEGLERSKPGVDVGAGRETATEVLPTGENEMISDELLSSNQASSTPRVQSCKCCGTEDSADQCRIETCSESEMAKGRVTDNVRPSPESNVPMLAQEQGWEIMKHDVLQNLEDEASGAVSSGDSTSERLSEGRRLIRRLVQTECESRDVAKIALKTLMLYLNNARLSPGIDQFRRINRSNPGFQRRVGRLPSAVDFLRLFGFRNGSSNYLQVTGSDPALLWMGADLLETYFLSIQ